jgi:RHS repeat-associated protein
VKLTFIRQDFTGYERDGETGLDFAEARYYAKNHGRFNSPDPLMASGNRSSFVYNAAGAVASMRLGNGKFENTVFNSRIQSIQIGLGSSASTQNVLKLNFDYGTTDNNGDVRSQTITVPPVGTVQGLVATQVYTYDSLNRIKQATEMIPNQPGWQQTFVYDRYGNRNFDEANTTTLPRNCVTARCRSSVRPTFRG